MHGVFLDVGSLYPRDLDLTELQASLDSWTWHESSAPDELAARLRDADVIVSNKVVLTGEVLRGAPRLRLICIAATGTNNVDIASAAQRGIAVCNVPDYATPSVVQHTMTLMLALRGHLPAYAKAVERGEWRRSAYFSWLDYPFEELQGSVLGIVGYGASGRGVARVAEALGMRVLVAALPGRQHRGEQPLRVPFAPLLSQIDVLSLHCPLAPNTRHLINAETLAAMKSTALLINTARGGLVDEAALAVALRGGQIAGAALDVVDTEPPRADSPLFEPAIENLLVTPHIAWGSRGSRQRLVNELACNIRAFSRGSSRHHVDVKQSAGVDC